MHYIVADGTEGTNETSDARPTTRRCDSSFATAPKSSADQRLPGRQNPPWLFKCAVERGASHYRRDFDRNLPSDTPALSNEELGVALCLTQHPYDPMLIRVAAQLLSSPDTDAATLARLAEMERCVPVLLHIADAAGRVILPVEPWRTLREILPRRHRVRSDALPHWSRFVLQVGYTSAGRGQHIEWLTRHE